MSDTDILNVKKIISENEYMYLNINSEQKWFMSLIDSLIKKSHTSILFIQKRTTGNYLADFFRKMLPSSVTINSSPILKEDYNINIVNSSNAVKIICSYIKNKKPLPVSMIMMDIEILNDVFMLSVLNLWKNLHENSNNDVPRLLLINNLSFHRNIPLDGSAKTYSVGENDTTKHITYRDKIYLSYSKDVYDDMVKMVRTDHKKYPVEKDSLSKWVVFFPTKEILNKYMYVIKNNIDYHVVVFPIDRGNSKAHINGVKGKRLIILTTGFEYLVTVKDVERVYDPMTMSIEINSITGTKKNMIVSSDKYTSENRLFKITSRDSVIKCIRMTTETEYETFKQLNNIFYPLSDIDNNILLFVDNNIDFLKIYEDDALEQVLKNRQDFLCQIGNIYKNEDSYKLSELGKISLKLDLSTKSSNFLARWISKKLPNFPGIIVACILDSSSVSIMYDRNYIADNVILHSLEICYGVLEHFQTLDIPNKELSQWARDHKLNIQVTINLIHLIKNVYKSLYNGNDNIELGLYNVKNVWTKCIDILIVSYNEDMYNLVDDDYYINNKDKTCFIPDNDHLPETVLVLGKKKNNQKDNEFNYEAVIYIDDFNT